MTGGVSWCWLTVSMTCSVLALLSKELGVTALGVCLVMDLLLLNKVANDSIPCNYN